MFSHHLKISLIIISLFTHKPGERHEIPAKPATGVLGMVRLYNSDLKTNYVR